MSSTTGEWGARAAREAQIDAALDEARASAQLSDDLFAVVDLLDADPGLRRVLSDPTVDAQARTGLVHRLLDGRVGEPCVAVVVKSLTIASTGPAGFSRGLERAGVRSVLRTVQGSGAAVEVEDELFRFGQDVRADLRLSMALSDADRPVEARRELVTRVLGGRAREETVVLAARAVRHDKADYTDVLTEYVAASAAMREERVAVVTTARGLSAEQRAEMGRQLERITGGPVDMKEVVDPGVLGGARINWGDEVIDGTVARRLDQARQTLG